MESLEPIINIWVGALLSVLSIMTERTTDVIKLLAESFRFRPKNEEQGRVQEYGVSWRYFASGAFFWSRALAGKVLGRRSLLVPRRETTTEDKTIMNSVAWGLSSLLLSAATGCTYLHSEAREKLAVDAQEEFEKVAQSPVFAEASEKFAGFQEQLEELSAEVHLRNQLIQSNTLLGQRWSALVATTQTALGDVTTDMMAARGELATAQADLRDRLATHPSVRDSVSDHLDALNEAERARARFAATQGLLADALSTLVAGDEKPAVERLRRALDKRISFTKWSVSNGELTEGSTPEETTASLLGVPAAEVNRIIALATGNDIKPADLEEILGVIKGLDIGDIGEGFTFRDPGIATVILGLGLDVARAREQQLDLEITYGLRRLAVIKSQIAALTALEDALTEELDANVRTSLASRAQRIPQANETIRDTLQRLVSDAKSARHRAITGVDQAGRDAADQDLKRVRGTIQVLLITLTENFRNRVVKGKDAELLGDRVAALVAEEALRVADANLGAREAVIGRGLEGLVDFHRAGFRAEDLDLLVQAAQTIGLAVIAGGVL